MYQRIARWRTSAAALGFVLFCAAILLGIDSLHAIHGHNSAKESIPRKSTPVKSAAGPSKVWSQRVPTSHGKTPFANLASQASKHPIGRQQNAMGVRATSIPSQLNTKHLIETFDQLSYDFTFRNPIATDIPRVYVPSIPADFKRVDVRTRKMLFIQMILPIILTINEQITADRQRLLAIKEYAGSVSELRDVDRAWVAQKAQEYRLKSMDNVLTNLLTRMDIIPPSLALAQAIEESGWGTSRFARHGNALFGQWTPSARGLEHPEPIAKGWRMASFPSLFASVSSYVRNLNTHSAYKELRAARLRARHADKVLSGTALVPYLHRYSERGVNYTNALHRIIRTSRLSSLDTAQLSHEWQNVAFLNEKK